VEERLQNDKHVVVSEQLPVTVEDEYQILRDRGQKCRALPEED
jgi:hypothetical protein